MVDKLENPRVMTTPISASAKAAGFWSAGLATVFSLAYVVGQLAEWLGWLGSRGGPESGSTVLGIVVLLTPSRCTRTRLDFRQD